MGSHLKLLAAVLVLMDGTQDGHDLLFGGQRDRTGYAGACALRGLHDLLCCGIHQLGIIASQSDSDFFP